MEWLNYHHLLYFWSVAKHGTVTKASEELRLAQPTISGQIRMLELSLGEQLFVRTGRRLALTEMGQVVFKYAEDIFATGQEMLNAVKGQGSGRPARLIVGIADVVPKPLGTQFLKSALKLDQPTHLVCLEDKLHRLLADLASHRLDLVISDTPAPRTLRCPPIAIRWANRESHSSARRNWPHNIVVASHNRCTGRPSCCLPRTPCSDDWSINGCSITSFTRLSSENSMIASH